MSESMDSIKNLFDDRDNDGYGEMTFGGQDGGEPPITEAAEPHDNVTPDNIIRRMSEEAGNASEFSNGGGSLRGRVFNMEHSTDAVRGADSHRRGQINRNDSAEPRGQQSRFTGGHDEFAAVNMSDNVQKPGAAVPPESPPRAAASPEIVRPAEPAAAVMSASGARKTGAAKTPEIVKPADPNAVKRSDHKNDSAKF